MTVPIASSRSPITAGTSSRRGQAAAADREGDSRARPFGCRDHRQVLRHLPLYRLEDIFARHGAELSRATMCGWMRQAAELLMPIHELLRRRVLASRVIHTDDTPVEVLDAEMEKGTGVVCPLRTTPVSLRCRFKSVDEIPWERRARSIKNPARWYSTEPHRH